MDLVSVTPAGCWEWTGARHSAGYGRRSHVNMHRASYERFVGPVPPKHEVCHACDNPPCVNPAHLWVGTHGDNMRDMCAKGRQNHPRGEDWCTAKLTADQVREARRRRAAGEGVRAMAREFGISHTALSQAIRGLTWRELT